MTTAGARPPWRRDDPAALLHYVTTGALSTLFPSSARLPGRSAAPPEVRLRKLFDAFAAVDVRYADEDLAAAEEQDIRPPDQVLVRPGRANCLDLAAAFAGGCLDAGLHPIIVLVRSADGRSRHALVVVWLRAGLGATGPFADVVLPTEPAWPGMGMRSAWDGPGEFAAVDVARIARGWPRHDAPATFESAVAAGGEMLTGDGWGWEVGVDVGLGYRDARPYPVATLPDPAPLEPPYHLDAPDGDAGPLADVRARNKIVPFEPRSPLDALLDWCLAADTEPGRMRVALLHGVGGAGKTRLAAELAHRLAEDEGWHTGFLRRSLTRPGAAAETVTWLAGVVSPLLVVVDYVEQAESDVLADHLRVLDARRSRTVVVLTARSPGDWRRKLDDALDSRGVRIESYPDERLNARHPNGNAVYRKAYRRFSPATGAPDTAPPLPAESMRWTTLEMVMAGWLAARAPQTGPPSDRTTLYERLLNREFDNWDAHLRTRYGREAGAPALRAAATAVCLASPTPEQTTGLVEAIGVPRLTSLAPGEIGEMLVRFLSEDDGALSVRPDPLADHLLVTRDWDYDEIDRCVDVVIAAGERDPDAPARLVANVTRAGDADRAVTGRVAGRVLGRRPGTFWGPALEAAWTRGGPFVTPLEELARADDTSLPLAELAEMIPLNHSALRGLALAAAQHVHEQETSPVTDEEQLSTRARSWNNLSIRQAENGDRPGALASITEAVATYRRLADTNPAFVPDLASSLNNLSIQQSSTGDRDGALVSITEAVSTYRHLADTNPAFLHNLATSLNNLSIQQSSTGDRVGALVSITEAVTLRRQLADTNPAFLPDLAGSLNNLSVQQSSTGDHAGALVSITEAVSTYRQLADTNPAAFVPDLAMSLNNLSNRQSDTGDRVGALVSITEAVTLRRQLADTNPTFLPDLATSLNNLSNRQSSTGDRVGALVSITEAVTLHRQLADTNPAFLPDLAGSLNNLSVQQSSTGDHAGALVSITEAVSTYRQLADTNPAAFLPDLAMSLNNLSNQQSDTGDRAGALVSITEAVTLHRQLADTNPAFLPDLAGSLNNLSVQQSSTGDHAGALVSITEAVSTYRQLADTNPAAFVPDLASSLNNLSNQQSNTGDRAGALASITEAATTYRQLADTNPAFLPDLAGSLNNLSIQQRDTGNSAGALASSTEAITLRRQLVQTAPAAFLDDLVTSLVTESRIRSGTDLTPDTVPDANTWEAALIGLPTTTQSRLVAHRCAWHRRASRNDEARADLLRAAHLVDDPEPESDLAQLSAARLQVRNELTVTPDDMQLELPTWATTELPDELIGLANTWLSGSWDARRRLLADPPSAVDTDRLRSLAAVHCDRPALQEWLELHTAVVDDPSGDVLAGLDQAQSVTDLALQWIATESWNASQAFLGDHPELRDPAVHDFLERFADEDVARQHLAILRLVEHVPANSVFDAILDPGDTRDLLYAVARLGDAATIAEVWFASPHLAADPVAGPLAFALFRVLGDDPAEHAEQIAESVGALAGEATPGDRKDIGALLAQLSQTRDDRAVELGRIATTLAHPHTS